MKRRNVYPLFTSLLTTPIPDDIDVIETTGHTHPGVGAARYIATKATGATPYRTRSANARRFELAEP